MPPAVIRGKQQEGHQWRPEQMLCQSDQVAHVHTCPANRQTTTGKLSAPPPVSRAAENCQGLFITPSSTKLQQLFLKLYPQEKTQSRIATREVADQQASRFGSVVLEHIVNKVK